MTDLRILFNDIYSKQNWLESPNIKHYSRNCEIAEVIMQGNRPQEFQSSRQPYGKLAGGLFYSSHVNPQF